MGKKLTVVLFSLLMGLSLAAQAQCLKPTEGAAKAIFKWYVFDGDTLDVGADKRLRLAFINTPELGRSGAADQPLAQAAKQAVVDFMQASKQVYWQTDARARPEQRRDRYGRHLGTLYNAKGEWLAEQLVRQGLAFVVSMPPHVSPACLWWQEAIAKQAARGVWATQLGKELAASEVAASHAGFVLLSGRVTKVSSAKYDWFVELDGDVALRINKQQWREHAGMQPQIWLQQTVSVRGWMAWRSLSKAQRQRGYKHGVLALTHPHMLRLTE
ncbi:MAG TPA: hypothetical protein DE179_07535 [Oceanospirillaceae bacterium]|nr:hypothetical protein [Oceanospirillaceae bacterium]